MHYLLLILFIFNEYVLNYFIVVRLFIYHEVFTICIKIFKIFVVNQRDNKMRWTMGKINQFLLLWFLPIVTNVTGRYNNYTKFLHLCTHQASKTLSIVTSLYSTCSVCAFKCVHIHVQARTYAHTHASTRSYLRMLIFSKPEKNY